MRSFLCALFIIIFSSPPVYADTDVRLLAALHTLQSHINLRTEVDRAARAGLETPVAVLSLTTALALSTRIPYLGWARFPGTSRMIITKSAEASTYAITLGALMYLGAKLYKLGRAARERRLPLDYHQPQGLRRFFEAPLDQQYILAQRDPDLAQFLITLADSFTTLDRGHFARSATEL